MVRGLDGFLFDAQWRCAVLKGLREGVVSQDSGGHGEGETPLPIPNRAVKPLSADGTWPARARESRTPPVICRTGRLRAARSALRGGAEPGAAERGRGTGRRRIRSVSGSSPLFASPDDLSSPPGYSHVVTIPAGRLVWTAGQIALDPDGKLVGVGDWESQARLVFQNLTRALEAAGAAWAGVVKLTFFVVDTSGLATIRAVRDEFVDRSHPPTSTLVQVAGLAYPDLLLEVEAVAWLP
jgi:enamine deaminase RidA (YjgF/YER057c/UK114 family)